MRVVGDLAVRLNSGDVARVVGGMAHRPAAAVAWELCHHIGVSHIKLISLLDGYGGSLHIQWHVVEILDRRFCAAGSQQTGKYNHKDQEQQVDPANVSGHR